MKQFFFGGGLFALSSFLVLLSGLAELEGVPSAAVYASWAVLAFGLGICFMVLQVLEKLKD